MSTKDILYQDIVEKVSTIEKAIDSVFRQALLYPETEVDFDTLKKYQSQIPILRQAIEKISTIVDETESDCDPQRIVEYFDVIYKQNSIKLKKLVE